MRIGLRRGENHRPCYQAALAALVTQLAVADTKLIETSEVSRHYPSLIISKVYYCFVSAMTLHVEENLYTNSFHSLQSRICATPSLFSKNESEIPSYCY